MRSKYLISVLFVIVLVACAKQQAMETIPSFSSIVKVGQYRSYQEAERIALDAIGLIDECHPTRSGSGRSIVSSTCYSKLATKTEPATDTLFYVFNFTDDDGFAIIAGDRQFFPLIAVTEKGHFSPETPTGVDGFDNYMSMVVSTLSSNNRNGAIPYSYYEDHIIGNQMPPLVSVRWGQTGVFGQYCPNGIAGCVITATAQILSYLEKPDTLVLSVDMNNDYFAGDTLFLDWPSIKEHIVNHTDSLACNAVHGQIGALMRELGAKYNANYYTNSTGAFLSQGVNVYSALGINCSSYAQANLSTIKSSLRLARPVQMAGVTNNSEGHSFVADGYKDYEVWRTIYALEGPDGEYIEIRTVKISESHSLHINWGWNGVCNGFFTFGTYNTASAEEYDTESNYVSYDFCNQLRMIANIKNPGHTPFPF